jgi:hypothetical protein
VGPLTALAPAAPAPAAPPPARRARVTVASHSETAAADRAVGTLELVLDPDGPARARAMSDDDLRRDLQPSPDEVFGDDPGQPPVHPLELALRRGLRYSGLRDVELDPRLLLYVPLELCERETVLPLSASDDLLVLATAFSDPDLELVEDRFPNLWIELVFAPIDRIVELHDELKAML